MTRVGGIVGREHVEACGGRAVAAPFAQGLSTGGIIGKVRAAYREA